MRFYFDEHVNGAITQALLRKNIDVLTVQTDGYGSSRSGDFGASDSPWMSFIHTGSRLSENRS